ncbi:hypothetical protein [Aquirufa rosea]|uniref:Lipoprotein n=1 Tax=Aquirufa rosea TaxID=2509241 RepID=A0A4Q1BXC2_9BACT|nr:hypothetical protein [Aquirufa rosea]RXK46831.1 hypothetical protein ESB04_11755 [Aquirufa rosea]
MLRICASFLLLGMMLSCTKQPDLAGFDLEKFVQDEAGCQDMRKEQVAWLKAHKENLKGVSSNDIEDLFGKPDIQQLADRNQEYYIYFLEKGPHCEKITNPSQSYSMAFRFSAIGLATEITFQNGLP